MGDLDEKNVENLGWKPKQKRSLGWTRHRCKDYIKMYL